MFSLFPFHPSFSASRFLRARISRFVSKKPRPCTALPIGRRRAGPGPLSHLPQRRSRQRGLHPGADRGRSGTYDRDGWCMYASANFERLVLGCIKADFCKQIFFSRRLYFSIFRDLQAPLSGEKKVRALFFSRKKRTFGGEGGRSNLSTEGALAKRGALACAYGALGAIYALPWVDPWLTLC